MRILEEAKSMKDVLIAHRRMIHKNAETHLELPITSAYVAEQLSAMGYQPQFIGQSGIVAIAGNGDGKTFLLRADMDALPILEENDLPYRSETGNMHACGHDFHTAMLLGAAQILKNHESEICGKVKLMFQPAEETMSGAKMMVENGVLENPKVDAAMMLHVGTGMPVAAGTVIISQPGVCAAASDWFTINVQGKGCHGAMPQMGIDPLNVVAHIHIALQEINARELSPSDVAVLTVGQMHGGNTSNVIPDTAYMTGTIRTFSEQVRELIKLRLTEIAKGIGTAFGATVEVIFDRGCPCNIIDEDVNAQVQSYCENVLGKENVHVSTQGPISASEDFSYVSNVVPATAINLAAGSPDDGYIYPPHHPKVTFDEEALPNGAAVYANTAIEWLKNN